MKAMVIGKFMPPHRGHEYLCQFAAQWADQLTIVVCTMPDEPIDGALRFSWMSAMMQAPGVHVVHLDKTLPQYPKDDPNFWDIWTKALTEVMPYTPDAVFASESYGTKLAECFGATYYPVDPSRELVPISGTQIRQDPLAYWDHLPREVRPHYALRVSTFGPESTGKSTLSKMLAKHYNTTLVPEYARTYLEAQQGQISQADLWPIAQGQVASEEVLAKACNKLLVCDTDVLATTIWSHALYNECDPRITSLALNRAYALTLLCDVDVPYVADDVRYLPHEREQFFTRCKDALDKAGRRYVEIRGSWEERFEQSVQAIDAILGA